MKIQAVVALSLLVAASAFSGSADSAKLRVKFAKAPQKGREGWIEIIAAVKSSPIISPRDSQSGLPTGKRQHKPFVVQFPASEAKGAFYNALVNNENVLEVTFDTKDSSGKNVTAKLKNPSISRITVNRAAGAVPYEEISFAYEDITFEWK